MERTLEFYELKNDVSSRVSHQRPSVAFAHRRRVQDAVEYKKRMRPLKVKLEDGTVKTVLIDDSDTVAQVCAAWIERCLRSPASSVLTSSAPVGCRDDWQEDEFEGLGGVHVKVR
jgi:hypothetical protein